MRTFSFRTVEMLNWKVLFHPFSTCEWVPISRRQNQIFGRESVFTFSLELEQYSVNSGVVVIQNQEPCLAGYAWYTLARREHSTWRRQGELGGGNRNEGKIGSGWGCRVGKSLSPVVGVGRGRLQKMLFWTWARESGKQMEEKKGWKFSCLIQSVVWKGINSRRWNVLWTGKGINTANRK